MKLKRMFYMALFGLMVVSCSKKEDNNPPVDTNTAPTISGKTFEVNEDISDTHVIGTMEAQDDDGDALSFSIPTNSDGLFEIGKTDGKLSLVSGKILDYGAKQQHTITVSVTDGTDSAQATVTINVNEVGAQNLAPQGEQFQSFEVDESITDSDIIGIIEAQDPEGQPLTFELLTFENDPGFFVINNNGELMLAPGKHLDYESATEINRIIKVSDGNLTLDIAVTIIVKDVPEADPNDKNAFVITWEAPGNNQTIYIGKSLEYAYDFQINWGDGETQNYDIDLGYGTAFGHKYETAGTYTVSIVGTFPAIYMESAGASPLALQSIEQWGNIEWQTMAGAFKGCTNMVYKATDSPNLENVIIMSEMFAHCSSFNGDLSTWDVSGVLNMSGMFHGTTSFVDGNIGGWITNEVLYMSVMFANSAFNGDISNWNVSNVIQMSEMFTNAINFNQDLGGWNIKSVNTMYNMLSTSGLDQANYSNTLIGWSAQQNVPADITLGSHELVFCGQEAIDARNELINTYGWQIFGDSQCQ